MRIVRIKDIDDSKEFLETLEGKNINFLIGAGASMPYLKTLSLGNKFFTFEDVFDESHHDNYDQKVRDYLSAYFLHNSLSKGTYASISKDDTKSAKEVKENYVNFIECISTILSRNSIQQPKRANIFTTNYDMFFEFAFDEVASKNSFVTFNDGSCGFVNKTISTERFHRKVLTVGVENHYENELPMMNIIKLHGSLSWFIESGQIRVKNDISLSNEFSKEQCSELEKIKEFSKAKNKYEMIENIEKEVEDKFSNSFSRLSKIAIVKPTKFKFSETVFQEHYYQMLRVYSQELEKKQSVLIVFGYSFADEHVRSITKRALSNPTLLMYIICYDETNLDSFNSIFQSYPNVIILVNSVNKDSKGDFTFINTLLRGN